MYGSLPPMTSSFINQSPANKVWNQGNVIKYSIAWSIISIAIYAIFSGPMSGADRPIWYRFLTAYALQITPVIISGFLCLRNGLSKTMINDKKPWMIMGIALLCFSIGNFFFSSWELIWHLNSTGCLGDPFFVVFYVLLLSAVIMVIWQRKIVPNAWQFLIIGVIAAYTIGLANIILEPVAIPPSTTTTTETAKAEPVTEAAPAVEVPAWVQSVDQAIKPYGKNLNVFYVWCDVCLLCLSLAILFHSWGSRLARSWQVTAQAVFFIYVADAWYAYAGNRIADYQAGFTLEVCWILGILQFGVAAAIEFEQSLGVRAAMRDAAMERARTGEAETALRS
jgi:hypothetical protein